MGNHVLPADIERTSLSILQGELDARGIRLPEEQAPVICRVIHATADFDFAETLAFTTDAVEQGISALAHGTAIVTDTNMALAGISRQALARLGCQALCYMADPDIAAQAKALGATRAVASMRRAAQNHPGGIFAVGNAPTALLELVRLIREENLHPALIVGVPVGFVNVEESKSLLWSVCREREIPAIVAMGRKGGSTVAAAICNALLYQAAGMADPAARGWQG